MNGLIISGHGSFASGLRSSVKLIAGDQPGVEYVDFQEQDTVADLERNLKAALSKLEDCDGVLFLCDLAGGSPFKTAVLISGSRRNCAVIGGANLGMIIETALIKDMHPIDTLKNLAIQTGKDAIKSFEKIDRPKKEGAGI
ncbi:PTS lactose transporter subunit IIA [Bacillus sp. V3-13]|uniref:PTS galactosamine/N-acetylgalactosamine transporter subunit IIA n=1 Tax=Bacillus sp. V3-13 TaxID=2053728 RepID=UPI000C767A8B|nr:PTS galactosamine/N-acetylgalactosamine transporter subunit IIA [Bacillus sp. V3-13]PLR75226.1 PTS lactose transporter subunit IIA [Bacillus sp. V3-13]